MSAGKTTKRVITSWFICLVCSLFLAPLPAKAWTGRVLDLPDARTLIVEDNGGQRTVKLYGLKVPKQGQAFAQEAHAFSAGKLLDRVVEIKPLGSGKRGALVFVQGEPESFNEQILRQGWAWVQEAYCENAVLCGRLNAIQTEAERAKRGIWAEIPENMPPWRWLKENRP